MTLLHRNERVSEALLVEAWVVFLLACWLSPAVAQTPPLPTVNAVVNAASFVQGSRPVAAGEIITIFGANMGPAIGVGASLTSSGLVDTKVANTQVLFDGIPAPLVFVRSDQINAIVPYAVAGKTTTAIVVDAGGVRSTAVNIPVAASAPGIFTAASTGNGQGAILNENGSANSSTNPAGIGSIIVLYATGAGQTNPAGIDGKLAVEPLPKPALPVSVTIGGAPAEILYYGAAPGFAGLLQVNARIPPGGRLASVHYDVAVTLTVGTVTTTSTVTLRVNPLPPEITVTPAPVLPCNTVIFYPRNGTRVLTVGFGGSSRLLVVGSVRVPFDFMAGSTGVIPAVATLSIGGSTVVMDGSYAVGQSTGSATFRTVVPDFNARVGLVPGSNGILTQFTIPPELKPYLDLLPLPNAGNNGDGTAVFLSGSEPYNGGAGRLTFTPAIAKIPPELFPGPGTACADDSQNVGLPFGIFLPVGISSGQKVVLTVTIGGITVASTTVPITY